MTVSDTAEKPRDTGKAKWPNTVRSREELDAALEASLKSGVSKLTGREIVDRALRRFDDG